MEQTKLQILIAAMSAALAANPTDEKALAQKEVSEAYEEYISSIRLENAKVFDEQVEKIKQLEAQVQKLQDKNAKFENPSFKVGEDEYEILVKHAKIPGVGAVTAADIAASEDLQKTLVEKQSGIIRKKA